MAAHQFETNVHIIFGCTPWAWVDELRALVETESMTERQTFLGRHRVTVVVDGGSEALGNPCRRADILTSSLLFWV